MAARSSDPWDAGVSPAVPYLKWEQTFARRLSTLSCDKVETAGTILRPAAGKTQIYVMNFKLLVLALALTAMDAASCQAERRVALVIGNAAYRHADRLANPVNDARAVYAALTKLSFDVTFGEDLDQKGLRRVIGQFADRVDGADVAIVYFAGHGATFGDMPYVVPVDAEFSSLGEAPYELVSLETLIGELRRAKGVRIAIVDACRDNAAERELKRQLGARGGEATRGLAPVKNPDGLIVAYATQYLSTAADNAGGVNSPFTAALLNNIAAPGIDVKDVFFNVGRDVVAATGGRQRPEISVSMYERYSLVPAAAQEGNAAVTKPPQVAVVAPPVAPYVPPATQAVPSPPSPVPRQIFFEGRNGTSFVKGSLRKAKEGVWIESNTQLGQQTTSFQVVLERPDGILLQDTSRDMFLEVNLRSRKVSWKLRNDAAWHPLYDITGYN
jgi:hypothetical protein